MRARAIVIVLSVVWVAPAVAQSPLDGPLRAPGASPAVAAPHRTGAKPKKARKAVAAPVAVPAAMPEGTPAAAPAANREAPADPLSLGMKWNGSNDTAGQTRSQNLDGNAFGSGAEVGMKLHF